MTPYPDAQGRICQHDVAALGLNVLSSHLLFVYRWAITSVGWPLCIMGLNKGCLHKKRKHIYVQIIFTLFFDGSEVAYRL